MNGCGGSVDIVDASTIVTGYVFMFVVFVVVVF